jgi:hypothetical protein
MKYDGTSDITLFLRRFDGLRTRILGLDPDHYDDFVIEATLSTCLEDANPSPSVGVDGERYIGPASWWAKQPIDDVDTYDKLKRKLESKFKAKVENMSKIFSRLAQLERGDKTVKDFAYEFDCVRGTAEVHDYTLIDIFTKQMPQTVVKRLLISCPDFREKTYEEVKNLCVKLDHAVRNPDPLENGYAKKFSKLRLGEDRQDHVARLERQLAESQKQLNHLLQGAERWTNSADALKHEASEHREKSSSRPRSGMVCWNCWKPGHSAADCRDTKRSDKERESLRQQLGVPATKLWEEQLQKHSSTMRAAPVRILTRKTDPREFQKYFGEAENLEPGRITEEGDRRRGRIGERTPRILEFDSESDGEERPVDPRHRLRNRDIYTSSREEHIIQELLRRFEDELRARETREEPTMVGEQPVTHHILTSEWKETEEFAQSSGARESSNDGQHVQLPARLAASKVFIIKRFKRYHLDVKPFLPTLGHTQLQNFRYEDIQSRLASGSDPPHHTTAPEELRGVEIEGLDTTVKTMAGSRDDCSLHTMTGVSIGRSPVLICEKMTEVNGKYVPSKYKITRLGPGPEPPPASDAWSLGFGDVKLTFLMVYIRRTFTFVFRTQGAHSRGQQHSLISYHVDYPGFLERPAGKNLKYCHYNHLDGQLYKHKWAIRKGFTRWLEVKLSLLESIVASPGQAGGRRARTYTGEADVMGSHFYHLKYGERLERGETIDAVDIEKTKFAAPGSDTRKLKELDGDDRDTGGGDTAKLTEPGGAHVELR